MPEDNEQKTETPVSGPGREATTFKPGNKAGLGRKRGARNKISLKVLEGLSEMTPELLDSMRKQIAKGNMLAARLIIDRLCPARREAPFPKITLPSGLTLADLPSLSAAVIKASADGKLTPHEALAFSSLLTAHMQILAQAEMAAPPEEGGVFSSVTPEEIEEKSREVREALEKQRGEFLPERREEIQKLRDELKQADSFAVGILDNDKTEDKKDDS